MPRRNKRNRRDHRKKEYWNKKYRQKGLENNVYMTIGEAVFCTRIVHRGEVWYADLGRFDNTSVQRGCRPVLIISNDASNEKSGMVTVLPMTTKMKKTWYPSHVPIGDADIKHRVSGQLQPSLILVEQIRTVDKAYLQNKVGEVKHNKMEEVEASIRTWMNL
ncbi:MAG: type II toxin-antitoxin system PemK/MazF family toxin [Lachnospiraceae bacterium]|nr:type II toxin-antitoxin system PemK/MazF family toxin [Lachnospiraceae bacterium]